MADTHGSAEDGDLDRAVIASLDAAIGTETLDTLMADFIAETAAVARRLAGEVSSVPEALGIAHSVKGAAGNYGAPAIATLMAEAERRGLAQADIRPLAARLDDAVRRFAAAWQAYRR